MGLPGSRLRGRSRAFERVVRAAHASLRARLTILLYGHLSFPISKNLQEGVFNVLKSEKIDFDLRSISGSLEIPFLLEKYKNQYLGYIIIGCVIKGETDHYEIVKNITFSQIYKVAYENILPL